MSEMPEHMLLITASPNPGDNDGLGAPLVIGELGDNVARGTPIGIGELATWLPDGLRPDDVSESGTLLWRRALSDKEVYEIAQVISRALPQLRAECTCGAAVWAIGPAASNIIKLFYRWHKEHDLHIEGKCDADS